MPQLQQVVADEEQSAYWSPSPTAMDSASARADTVNEETRREINRPGRAAYGDPLIGELPASARHVRPDELLAALTAIEARKGEAVVGTMPIGETLEKIGAEVTPEEVWQEVYAQRGSQNKSHKLSDFEAKRRRKRWIGGGVAVACIFSTAIALRVLAGDVKAVAEKNAPPPPVQTGPIVQRPQEFISPALSYQGPDMIPLSQLPEGKPFRLGINDAQMIDRLRNGDAYYKPLSQEQMARVAFNPNPLGHGGGDYQVVSWNKKMYLQGWIDAPPGTRITDVVNKVIKFYNRPDHPELPPGHGRQFQIPSDAFRGYSGRGNGPFYKTEGELLKLDGNAWEPFEPLPLVDENGVARSMTGGVSIGFGQSVPMEPRVQPYRPAIRVHDARVLPQGNGTRVSIGKRF